MFNFCKKNILMFTKITNIKNNKVLIKASFYQNKIVTLFQEIKLKFMV